MKRPAIPVNLRVSLIDALALEQVIEAGLSRVLLHNAVKDRGRYALQLLRNAIRTAENRARRGED